MAGNNMVLMKCFHMVHGNQTMWKTPRPSPAAGHFPCHPVGEGLAPPAGFRNFSGQRWGGGAPGRRALRMSWSTKGGQPSVAARPPLRDVSPFIP